MQSFIVIHQDKRAREQYLENFLKKETISVLDINRIIGEISLGIEEIRLMQKSVFLTPVKGDKKAIILEDAQTLTIEAQNALLKLLEEPPSHALFFLSTTTANPLLPTILSRCSLVVLQDQQKDLSQEEMDILQADFQMLFSNSISSRLNLAEKIASQKNDTSIWLRNSITYMREALLEDIDNQTHLVKILTHLQEAYRLITTTNTNPRTLLEHSFLSY